MPPGARISSSQNKIRKPGWQASWPVACAGPRDAAHGWKRLYTRVLTTDRFIPGRSGPCIFYKTTGDVILVVRGDGSTAPTRDGHERLAEALKASMALKVKATPGPEGGDDKSAIILKRIASWTEDGTECEYSQRHI
eukprot:1699055-Pyramimonas_sp.AAC.1